MSHCRYDRNRTIHDGPRHRLFVERPEVLERTPAPTDDDHVAQARFTQCAEGTGDLTARPLALHARPPNDYTHPRRSAAEHGQNVADGGSGCRRHHAHGGRKAWKGTLACRVQNALALELRAQFLECQPPQPFGAFGLETLHAHLVFATSLVECERTEYPNLHSLFRVRGKALGVATPEHASELCPVVLEREVAVPGSGAGPAPHLPTYPQRVHCALEKRAHGAIHLGHGPDPGLLRRRLGRVVAYRGRFLGLLVEEVEAEVLGQRACGLRTRRRSAPPTPRCWTGAS
jgi:hypothetical protein